MSETEDSRYQLLDNNAQAVRALMQAVEGTIGSKGLDTMLLDQFGSVTITNDGMTILEMMEVKHPVAKMLINAVKSQQETTGDGTTTTALYAGEMILSGIERINQGVPVAQVIKGIRMGLVMAEEEWQKERITLDFHDTAALKQIAQVAAREYDDIALLITEAAEKIGEERLKDQTFAFAESIKAKIGAEGEVFNGIVLSKSRYDKQMPAELAGEVKVLVIDDALESEEFDDKALATESGFQEYMKLKNEFRDNVEKILHSGAKLVLVDRGVDEQAAERLADHGIMLISRIPHKELEEAASHVGAKMIKRTGLKKDLAEIQAALGTVGAVKDDEILGLTKLADGKGEERATVIIGAATDEVVGERERIAKDAAAALQAAVQKGVVAGGGAAELAVAEALEKRTHELSGMSVYGLECVIKALRKPFMQIVKNAGFNPLEKLGDVVKAQNEQDNHHLAIDCETGEISDMRELGVIDPLYVKTHAIDAAGEVAAAILKINIIIKKKEYQPKENS